MFSEMLVLTRATQHNIPEDGNLHNHCCENLKAYRVDFISDRMPYIILRSHRFHIIALNVQVPTQDKTDVVKDSFYDELEMYIQ
jgi:hypothetical protein